jgi:hypothetical protein
VDVLGLDRLERMEGLFLRGFFFSWWCLWDILVFWWCASLFSLMVALFCSLIFFKDFIFVGVYF